MADIPQLKNKAIEELVASILASHPGKRLVIGYSGGVDSRLLLYAVKSMVKEPGQLLAVHVNHGLQPEAGAWQQHCEDVCSRLGIPFVTEKAQIPKMASIEAAARDARYRIFENYLQENDVLLLGQHSNDQAETMLFRLMRGTGVDGLAGIRGERTLATKAGFEIPVLRPFLALEKQQLVEEANNLQLDWIQDESNDNDSFDRNFIRNKVIPVLEQRWPGAVGKLTGTAELAAEASDLLAEFADQDLQGVAEIYKDSVCGTLEVLSISKLLNLSKPRQVNALRRWISRNGFVMPAKDVPERLIQEVCLAKPGSEPKVCWAGNMVTRFKGCLFISKELPGFDSDSVYPISEVNRLFKDTGLKVTLPEGSFSANAEFRFRKGGEKLKVNGVSKSLKNLFQENNVLPWLRERLPLIYEEGGLVYVCGLPASLFQLEESQELTTSLG